MLNKTDKNRESGELFQQELSEIIDHNHRLCLFAEMFEWEALDEHFEAYFTNGKGRETKPLRLMAGLFYLKSLYNISDDQLIATWVENPYWQYFCGERYFQHQFPIHPSSLTKWRKLLGANGIEKLLEILICFASSKGFIPKTEFETVVMDTTVQEKNITYPTDSKLCNKARVKLVKRAQELDIDLRQSYSRIGRRAFIMSCRYAHARQYKRMKREIRKLRCYLGRVIRDIERKSTHLNDAVLQNNLAQAKQLLLQTRSSKNKLYSLHSSEVECIAKGKVHKKYEFGVKVGIVTTLKHGWILCSKALHGNPYDGHTLEECLADAESISKRTIKEIHVDKGYKGHGVTDKDIFISGQKRGITPSIKKRMKRRQSIEPIIGHMKSDHGMGINYLAGKAGDGINAISAAIGFNLNKLLKMMVVA